ncbi:hypothetical protein QBC39DRAFT_413583 [Podospora conica]|nr:hypothetical protein QBC39DRAFT_413583 [Schizothecium conicum]
MPFLRRRANNMASDSDMRRHTLLVPDSLAIPNPPLGRSESEFTSTPDLTTSLSPVAEDSSMPSIAISAANHADNAPDRISTSSSRYDGATVSFDLPDRPASPPVQHESQKHRRFSMLRFRNASDSQLAAKAKLHAAAEKAPPLPRRMFSSVGVRSRTPRPSILPQPLTHAAAAPEIITTAPTFDENLPRRQVSRLSIAARLRRSGEMSRNEPAGEQSERLAVGQRNKHMAQVPEEGSPGKPNVTFDEPRRPASAQGPPPYGEDHSSTLALPVNRLSESSRSDASSGDRVYGSTTTTTHTVHTTTTFFRIPRRKRKQPESLFPIAHLQPKSKTSSTDFSSSSLSAPISEQSDGGSVPQSPPTSQLTPTPSRPSSRADLSTPPTSMNMGLFSRPSASPATAFFRPSSRQSGTSSPTRPFRHNRARSSTMSSLGRESPRESVDEHLNLPVTRTSSSTGRKSFSDLLGLSKLRQNSTDAHGRQGTLTPATPGSNTSKNNSLQLARNSIILPERREDDTPSRYLERLLEVISRSVIAAAVSKGTDTFSQSVLRSYMRSFRFFEDPMDMAIRKLLMEAELPKETQQIDRCIQAFANRYHECNPGIYANPDQAYFIAFSLLILHTDVFNKNNKHKMQKADYLKNTKGEGIFDEILEVFYDNISYTPFIHVEDDLDINGERIIAHKARKKSIFPNGAADPAKRAAKEPVDPYTLILDDKLDVLRPNLKEVMQLDDPYSYLGTAKSLNLKELQKTFFKTGVLQIISRRSRPDAFMDDKTATNPQDAHPGIVDIKITKVGILWRKDAKKKKTRSPWQEWGAILTGAQLYFFRNVAWIKSLMHQYEDHLKKGHDGDPCIFHPPLEQFKPDALMSTDGAVALRDSTYTKHKNAFVYVRHGGFEEVLLAEDEQEMNDWLAKLNYAAAFRTSGVRMRGVVGSGYDGQGRRAMRRLDTDDSQAIQTPTGEVTIARSRIDHKMAEDILAARRAIMLQKVADADEKLDEEQKVLDAQLRNSRHLQLLAPIQPKTREQMLLSAAKMAAALKWTRMDIWRIKCHRDILLMDLEEERQLLGLPDDMGPDDGSMAEKAVVKEEQKAVADGPAQKSPHSPPHLSLAKLSSPVKSDEDSPGTEVFQTPPTSATSSSFHRHQNSWELPGMTFNNADLRKGSISSVISSNPSVLATPPRSKAGSVPATEKAKFDRDHDVDAEEHDLLEQTGLAGTDSLRASEKKPATPSMLEAGERHERNPTAGAADRSDRNKIRRSLQRTLREGAGHISHHRSRKGRDSASSGGMSDETARDGTDVLARGTGSFVVHGKKASVITFGTELQMQSLSPDDRIRQWKTRDEAAALPPATAPAGAGRGIAADVADFRSILTARSDAAAARDRDHRSSNASASTATARSFRELHRKYSSAQAAKGLVSSGSLALPSDEDSDAAVSFSDGRRTPLPPIEAEEDDDEVAVADDGGGDVSPPPSRRSNNNNRQTVFFTPEQGASPVKRRSWDDGGEGGVSVGGAARTDSPPVQPVGA